MKIRRKTNDLHFPLNANKKALVVREIIRDRYLYLLLVPFILFYVYFMFKPMWGLQIAFKNFNIYKGIENSPWIGLENFKSFIFSPYFGRTLINTMVINTYSIIFGFPAPIILALLLNEVKNRYSKSFMQTLYFLPYFVSIVVIAGIVINFLAPSNGLINIIISKLGGEKVYFLTKPKYFRTIFTIMNIWKDTGFNTVIYIAALSAIDIQLYEACIIDGGNKWKQMFHVTLPGILATIIIMLIMKIGSLLEVGYEAVLLLYQPATYETADVISTYVFRTGLQEGNYGVGTAVGLFNSIIALILVCTANKISNKVTQTGLW